MSEHLRESVSAVMDGEASELELRRILSDDNIDRVRSTWARYHATKNMLNNDYEPSFRDWDISAKVSAAISDEPVHMVAESGQSTWWRPVAGFAVAASVAFAVVLGVQTMNPAGITPDSVVTSAQPTVASRVYPVRSASPVASGNMLVGANYAAHNDLPGARAASKAQADLEAQKRLEKYILRHAQNAALNNGKGMISFAGVANFEAQ